MEPGRTGMTCPWCRECDPGIRPCKPPCGPVCHFRGRGGSSYHRKRNPPCWGDLGRGPESSQSSVGSGSKSVQVKGFMLLSQPKPGKHRPAKPCGKTKVHNFFRDTEIFYACSRKSDRSFGDFGREKVNTRGE